MIELNRAEYGTGMRAILLTPHAVMLVSATDASYPSHGNYPKPG